MYPGLSTALSISIFSATLAECFKKRAKKPPLVLEQAKPEQPMDQPPKSVSNTTVIFIESPLVFEQAKPKQPSFGNGGVQTFSRGVRIGGSNCIFSIGNGMVISGGTVINGNIVGGSGAEVLYFTETYFTVAKKSIEHVVTNTTGGNITVTGSSAEHKVEVYVGFNNSFTLSKKQIQARFNEHYELEMEVKNGTLTTSAHQKSDHLAWHQQLNIGFKVYVPEKVSTDLHTVDGNITLKNLSGNQDFRTRSGNLTVDRVTGQIQGSTLAGDINLLNSNDDIDMNTTGGNVNASDCSGRLYLRTVGGDVGLDRLKGTIKARTVGGNVRADTITGSLSARTTAGNLALDKISGTLEASIVTGHLSVSMTKITGSMKVTNSFGNVDLKLPSSGKFNLNATGNSVSTSGLGSNFGKISTTSARGKINGGGASVTVNGSRVNINVV